MANDITTTLYQYLSKNFGNLDWSLGSVLRELVAEPLASLAEAAGAAVNEVYNSLNITSLLANPEEHSESIDALFVSLGLNTPTLKQSSGSVKLLVEDPDDFNIAGGTSFTYNDITLVVPESYLVTAIPITDTDILLKQVGYKSYEAVVPVNSTLDGVSIGSGVAVNWSGINASIYSATVYSPITGGVSTYTATQKINVIRQLTFPQGLSCSESLLRTINSYAADTAVDCWLAPVSPLGTANVYVKATSLPQYWVVEAQCKAELDGDSQRIYCHATIPGTGIARVVSIDYPIDIRDSAEKLSSTKKGRDLNITFELPDSFTGDAPETVKISVEGFKELITAQAALDMYTLGTGVTINVLTPRPLYLELRLPISGMPTSAGLDICNAINNSKLNVSTLGDITTRPILAKYGITLSDLGRYILKDPDTGASYGSLAVINPSIFISSDTPYAIYTGIDRIATNG